MLTTLLYGAFSAIATLSQQAHTIDLDSSIHSDHNHHRIDIDVDEVDWGLRDRAQQPVADVVHDLQKHTEWDGESAGYQADFPSWGPGSGRDLIGRAAAGVTTLNNNVAHESNLNPGDVANFVFEKSQVSNTTSTSYSGLVAGLLGPTAVLSKRSESLQVRNTDAVSVEGNDSVTLQSRQNNGQSRTVYISVNTCTQPTSNGSQAAGQSPPQLTLYISTDSSNQSPGPGKGSNQQVVPLVQGYASIPVVASSDVFIGVSAPSGASTAWSFEVAASINHPTRYYNNDTSFLWALDTDSGGALLASFNLTDGGLSDQEREAYLQLASLPFSLFLFNHSDAAVNGMMNSYCGLAKAATSQSVNITTSMTARGFGQVPKQQFHLTRLSSGQDYTAILAYKGSDMNQVWQPVDFSTKSDGNCALIFDLPFCDTVAYSVPTNGTLSPQDLALLYDNNTAAYYQNFNFSLQQVACNTASSAQYSLERNCEDCARDYKAWLCAVTIPRCTDFSTPQNDPINATLAPRQVGSAYPNGSMPDLVALGMNPSLSQNSWNAGSRVSFINDTLKPGPYKEVLPCRELCYEIVKSCPASLGFSCPVQEALWDRSYARLDLGALSRGGVTCNYPGIDWPTFNSGARLRMGLKKILGVVAVIAVMGLV